MYAIDLLPRFKLLVWQLISGGFRKKNKKPCFIARLFTLGILN